MTRNSSKDRRKEHRLNRRANKPSQTLQRMYHLGEQAKQALRRIKGMGYFTPYYLVVNKAKGEISFWGGWESEPEQTTLDWYMDMNLNIMSNGSEGDNWRKVESNDAVLRILRQVLNQGVAVKYAWGGVFYFNEVIYRDYAYLHADPEYV